MRRFLSRVINLGIAASCMAPFASAAQGTTPTLRKALVYCPTAIDEIGCGNIVIALAAQYPDGVDKGYDADDAANHRVDLRTVDLSQYQVFLVPSLADGAGATPYAFLRDATVSQKLKSALKGRIALWSGTPDLGSSNADLKAKLIVNLAAWAGANYQSAKGPGLVSFLDQSATPSERYNWLPAISGLNVTDDSDLLSYSSVSALTATGTQILTSGASLIAYDNMAAFGFFLPQGAAGASLDAIGHTDGSGGQVVLLTSPGVNSGGAILKAERSYYFTGAPTAISGSGWSPNEGVSLTFHEDPQNDADRTVTVQADGSGNIAYDGFSPDAHTVDVRFILTAVGQSSGHQAQATFAEPKASAPPALNSFAVHVFLQAHQDDWQLFLGDRVAASVQTANKAIFVYVTAGDAGTSKTNPAYWQAREDAANASVQGTLASGAWACGNSSVNSHTILRCTQANAVTYYLRLPDGGGDGSGAGGLGSIAQLRAGTISSLSAIDGSATYPSWFDLVSTTQAIVAAEVGTQAEASIAVHANDWNERFNSGDHADHMTTGELARAASVGHAWNLFWYVGYPNLFQDANVLPGTLTYDIKWNLVLAYDQVMVAKQGSTILGGHTQDWAERTLYRSDLSNGVPWPAPQPPAAPSTLQPEVVSSTRIDLTWKDNSTDEIGFRIERAPANGSQPGAYTRIATLSANTTNYGDQEGLSSGTTYWYRVKAFNDNGESGASNEVSATTIVDCVAPTITTQPAGGAPAVGSPVTLAVTAAGSGPLSYQWQKNGANISGATTSSYVIPSVALADAGDYRVVVTNACGSTTSETATLTVNKTTPTVSITSETPTHSVYGQSFPVHVTVAGVNGVASPTGSVRVASGSASCTLTLTNGAGNCPLSPSEAGTQTITAAYSGDVNYLTGQAEASIAIAPAQPVFSNLSSQTISYGTSTLTLGGKLLAGSLVATGNVTVTLGAGGMALVQQAALQSDGSFVSSFSTASLAANPTPYPISYSFAGNSNFAATSDNTTTLTVTPATTANVTAVGGTFAYDAAPHTGSGSVTDPSGQTLGTVSLQYSGTGTTTYGPTTTAPTRAGTYSVTALFAGNGNYAPRSSTPAPLSITPKALTLTATASDKTYDGNTTASANVSVAGTAGTDNVTVSGGVATFDNKNVGSGKTVTITGVVIGGADAVNYTLASTSTSAIARINPKALTVTVRANNKIYDGTSTATVTTSDNRVAGDALAIAYASASFADKNAAVGKPVSVTGITVGGADATNYTVSTTANTVADITPRQLSVSAAGVDKVYDGTTAATVRLADDRITGDVLTAGYATAVFADRNVGTGKSIAVSGIAVTGADATNYTANATTSATASITAKSVTGTMTASSKEYDGTTDAVVAAGPLAGLVAGDDARLSAANGKFASKAVGTSVAVTADIAITGSSASNYRLASTTATTLAAITPKALTGIFAAANKVYDGTTAATISSSSLPGVIGTDVATLVVSNAVFDTKNVGADKLVSATLSLSGGDAGNYRLLSNAASTKASITAAPLTITATAADKVYDGTSAATVTLADKRVTSDVFTTSYTTGSFSDKNVGSAKSVSVSGITISGADAANYTVNGTASTTAAITPRQLSMSAVGVDKVYDGTTAAMVRVADDRIAGDQLTTSYTSASFGDKNVGSAKPITISGITIAGPDAGNYAPPTGSMGATATITARPLTISAAAKTKVYDGMTSAEVTLADNHVAGDAVTATYATASFTDKNVGSAKPVTVSGVALAGTDRANYTFNSSVSATADITARPLLLTAAGVDKVYDATTTASVTITDDHIRSDAVTVTYTSAKFADKNVGTGKPITLSGLAVSGTDAANYLVNATVSATASITPRALAITGAGADKVYDGTTAATVRLADDRIIGDVLTAGYATAVFADRNVGTGKSIAVSGIAVTGADATNYTANATTSATASITAKSVTGTITASSKEYDGTTDAVVAAGPLADLVAGDDARLSAANGKFASKAVGTWTVTADITLAGSSASNYQLASATATTSAAITAKAVTGSFSAANKIYDGNRNAAVSNGTLSGVVGTDAVTLAVDGATFDTKNVGANKVVAATLSLAGSDAGNYRLTSAAASTTASITPAALSVTAAASDKIYDGTTAANVTLSGTPVAGDALTVGYGSASFTDKNVGTAKTITVSGIAISGADAANYSVSTTTSTSAAIKQRALTVSAAGVDKVYDGTTAATVTVADNRISGDVLTTSYTSASFTDKNVGPSKPITVSGITVAGTDAGNYAPNGAASTTASITARPLVISAAAKNKIYDGTTAADATLADNHVAGDVVTATYATASFADKNVGNAKVVTVSGLALTGTDAANYAINSSTAATASITPRALTMTAVAASKVYDGTTAATVTLTDDRIGGDTFTASFATASFADPNVGTGKPVKVDGITLTGADGGNYTFNTSATASADIVPAPATISLSDLTQPYNGAARNVTAITNPSGLDVSISYSRDGAPVAAPTNAGSYTVLARLTDANHTAPDATGTLVITKATAVVTLGALSQGYDGLAKHATATTNPAGLAVTITYSRDGASVASPTNAGSYAVVGTVAEANYQGTTTGTLVIAPAALSIVWNPATRVLNDQTTAPAKLTASQLNASVVKPNGTTVSTSLTYTFASTGAPAAIGSAMPVGLGTGITAAYTSTDPNYSSPTPVTNTFDVLNVVDFLINNPFNIMQLSDTKTTEYTAAFITTADFDASTVDPASVLLGDGIDNTADATVERKADGTLKYSIVDVNVDGKKDLLLYFTRQSVNASGLTTATTQIVMRGKTKDGRNLRGTDKVSVSP